jgi:large subunit ribosomal protein L5
MLMNYYQLVIKYDLINKFIYKNIEELPKLEKINLNFRYDNNNFNLKSLALAMMALELITKQKGKLTQHLNNNTKLSIKIRKGYPVGCKVTLRKLTMYEFFLKLLINIFPKIKNFYGVKIKKNLISTISFKLKNTSAFNELEKHHTLFKNLPFLEVTFVTNTKSQKELLYLIVSHKLPVNININK